MDRPGLTPVASSIAPAPPAAARRAVVADGTPKRLVGGTGAAFGPLSLALLAIVLGVAAGLGAFVFRTLIAVVHDLCFLGRLSTHYDTSVYTPPSPWGNAIALVPVLGAIVVVFLVKNFAPEARGHGVPEVMDAIYYGKGVIRPVVAVVKSVASALSIGTGGSVGREGPIVQIAAAFASWLGRVARVSRWQRATLIAAWGGAGIAATFNTPIGGVLFAVEVLLHEVSVRTLVPVALSTATATYVGQRLFGDVPAFIVPAVHASGSAAVLPAYVALGVLTALLAVGFIRTLYGAEDFFERAFPRNEYVRHVAGMLGVGITIALLMSLGGHYYVEGVGYATIVDVLTGGITSAAWLVGLCALKLLTTSLTLGSGGSGGVFSPSLVMGATLGYAFGLALRALFPGVPFDPATLALAGMAGTVAGATGAALTAIVMIFEMTLDYAVVLPMALTVAVSHGVRRALSAQNIYTTKLARRGHYMPEALQANAHLVHHVSDMAFASAAVATGAPCPEGKVEPDYLVLMNGPNVTGVVATSAAPARTHAPRDAASLERTARRDFVVASCDTTIFDLMSAMGRANASLAVIVGPGGPAEGAVRGVVTKAHIAEALTEGMEIFQD
ncbi:MAG: chloride channel protein [Polyangiaceae bacterium]